MNKDLKHWHGATPNAAMTHIAIQDEFNGKVVEWIERSPTNNTGGHCAYPLKLRRSE
jgi:hypothetical protein